MVSSRLLFDLLCEWNRWAGQRGKVLILIVGFSLISFVFAMVLRLGDVLFFENPDWVGSEADFYTLSSVYDDGRQAGVSQQTIASLKDLPYVTDVAWLRTRTFDFRSNDYALYQPLALVFEPHLVDLLQLEFPATDKRSTGVWLTQRYWREAFNSDPEVVGKYLTHEKLPNSVPIRGVLPQQFNRIGPWSPDILLPADYLRYVTPFAPSSTLMIDRFLRSVPEYYGFFKTRRPIDVERLTQEMRNNDFSVQGMQVESHGGELNIFNGIMLDQKSATMLKQLWTFSVLLVIALVSIFSLNAFMSFSNRNLLLADEYRVLQTIGAQPIDLVRPVIVASVIKIGIIALISLGLNVLASHFIGMNDRVTRLDLFSLDGKYPYYWALSLVFITLIYATAIIFPLMSLRKKTLFSRVMGTNRGYKQLLVGQGSLIFQLSIAIIATIAAIQISKQQLALFAPFNFNTSVQQVVINHHGGRLPIESIEDVRNDDTNNAMALSVAPFDKPQTISVGARELGFEREFEVHYVSQNYFNQLSAQVSADSRDWKSGVVINRTAQQFLAENRFNIRATPLYLGKILGSHRIFGVVDDIPHGGRFKRDQPRLYLPLSTVFSTPQSYTLYLDERMDVSSSGALQNYLDTHLVDAQITSTSTLKAVIDAQEVRAQQLFYFSISVVIITLFGIALTLGYQVRSRLQLEKADYGVLIAIGAPFNALLIKACKPIAMAFGAAVIVTFSGYMLLVHLGYLHHVNLASAINLIALVLVGLITLSAVVLPLLKLTRSQVIDLIKQE
ncbi:MAG: hypothetical protein VYD07_07065 [Pseudomonadota bacterium]|nr:hypothetical protein [Pseudomonadota bacterium]